MQLLKINIFGDVLLTFWQLSIKKKKSAYRKNSKLWYEPLSSTQSIKAVILTYQSCCLVIQKALSFTNFQRF